jgi:hypothetical protein
MLGRKAFIHPKRIYTEKTIKKYQKGIKAYHGHRLEGTLPIKGF